MSQSTAEVVGANVRAEMSRAGKSQNDLAAVLGVTQTAVSKRLRGVTPFDVNEIALVARALDVDMSVLIADPARQTTAP
jgi:transcriptional regulator with XRE-family HTH domain